MKLIAQNEDGSLKTFDASEQNCKDKGLEGASGLVRAKERFLSAIWIFKALDSNARAILYDVEHKSLSEKLTNELKLPVLSAGAKERVFDKIEYDVMLFTSGTTGMPSGVFKSKKHLFTELCALEKLIKPYNAHKMVASVPFIHIYGILMLLLARETDMDLWLRERFLPSDLAALVDKDTIVATTPLYINALLQMSEEYDFGGALFISSTAPLSQSAAAQFCARFNANIIQLYGSTETGGIAYRKNGDTLWTPIEGVICAKGNDECLNVKSPWVSDVAFEGEFRALNGQIQTFDEVEFQGGKFELKGRRSNILKIGGKRLSILQIEEIIEKCPKVRSCLIERREVSDGSLKDEQLLVYIEGERPSQKELNALIKNELGNINIPLVIIMVSRIQKSAVGKKLRDFSALERL